MRAPKILVLVLLSGISAACATKEPQKLPNMSLAQNFVPMAVSSDKFEIESSKLALMRSHDPAVRRIARRMIADHTASSKKMAAILEKDNIPVPSMMAHHQKSLGILRGASDFDEQYLETQDVAHRQGIRLFQIYSQSGDNNDLRKFAHDTLPTLQKHHDLIEKARTNEYPSEDRSK